MLTQGVIVTFILLKNGTKLAEIFSLLADTCVTRTLNVRGPITEHVITYARGKMPGDFADIASITSLTFLNTYKILSNAALYSLMTVLVS